MNFLKKLIVLIIILIIAGAIWIWSGSYNIGADTQHWGITKYLIGKVRSHSMDHRTADIEVPDLDDPAMVREGAEHYAHMCVGCHLAPGVGETDIRKGLNPEPPNLTAFKMPPKPAFWGIKHGIRMTGMPAWGKTHDDDTIWAIVAYLQKQPDLSADRFEHLSGLASDTDEHAHADEKSSEPAHNASATSASSVAPAASSAAEGGSSAPPARAHSVD